MTADDFRRLALALPDAVESGHMGHPDFRVRNKIFATLGHPDAAHGVLKLTPAQQQGLVASQPEVFEAVAGAWGRRGMTMVRLRAAKRQAIRRAMVQAWSNTAPRTLVREHAGRLARF